MIPAVLCVDVEPDLRVPTTAAASGWVGFERLMAGLDGLRACMAHSTGRDALIGWFLRMDPQVEALHGATAWVADRYDAELGSLLSQGDELGLHPHSWRWEADAWCSDQSADWVAHCARTALDAYETAFGLACHAYRHGDRFTSPELVALLQAHGVRCDIGLEPGRPPARGLKPSEPSRGEIPGVPADWVRPFVAGAGHPAEEDVLMLPLTSSLASEPGARDAPFGTLLLWTPPRTFAALLDARLGGSDVEHLAFAVRTDLALEGGALDWVAENLAQVGTALEGQLEWVTPAEARRRLLPTAVASPDDSRWPFTVADATWPNVAQRVVTTLQEEEVSRRVVQERCHELEAVAAGLEASLLDARTELAASRAGEAELRAELGTLRGTVTWRLHQRLLPVLRILRRPFRPRGGSRAG